MKNDHIHESGKVRRSNAISTKLFSVVFCDLKSMSFKFGNAISNTFEMPRSSYLMSVGKFTFCCYSVHLLQRSLHKGIHIWMQLHKCFAPSSLRSLKLLTVPKRKTLQHWVWFEHIYGFYIEQILQSSYHIVNSKLVCRWDFGLWNRISQHRYSTRIQKYWF